MILLSAALLLASQATPQAAPAPDPEAPAAGPNFALPFETGQLVMSFLDGPPFCHADGRGAFVEPARHACERIEPSTTPVDASSVMVLGGMVVEVQREGQTAVFPTEIPQSLPVNYEAVAEIEVNAEGRAVTCRNISEDRHSNGTMFAGEGGMCAEMLRDPHPFLADPATTGARHGRVSMRSFSTQPNTPPH